MKYFIKKSDNKMIEPEEILLDKGSAEKLDDSKLEMPIEKKNFFFLFFIIIFVFFIFLGRSVQFQVFSYEDFSALSESNKTRSYPILSKRGVVYDRNLKQLVYNIPSFDLVIIPANLPKRGIKREEELIKIAKVFSLDEKKLLNKFKNIGAVLSPVLIKENIKREEALFIETRVDEFSGVELKKNSVRNYKNGEYFSHILGYTGKVSENDLLGNKNFSPLDYKGKSGLELVYDDVLRGVNGRMVQYVDSVLRIKKERKVKDAVSGNNLILSIDSGLQEELYKDLLKKINEIKGAEGAAAIALDPNNGEVLAMVSLPSYDNNIFSSEEKRKEYKNIAKNPKNPFFNRPISGVYPPGSSLKPFIASAALQEGTITKNTKINDIGYISIPNIYNPKIVYTFRDWKVGGHGIVDVKKALAVSSNVFFYTVGGGYGGIEGLGIDRIKKYLNLFGFGRLTNIDLNGEDAGLIPDKEWKKNNKRENWFVGDTYNSAIGQGNILVTPLQLASATAAIANGGKLFEPKIVSRIIDKNGNTIKSTRKVLARDNFIDSENLRTVREGMRMAVTEGSARRLKNFPVKIAGKTGTAQIGGDDTHAWFTSFAPYDDPKIVLTILIEKGGEGSAAAVPVAKEVYKYYFGIEDEKSKNSDILKNTTE